MACDEVLGPLIIRYNGDIMLMRPRHFGNEMFDPSCLTL